MKFFVICVLGVLGGCATLQNSLPKDGPSPEQVAADESQQRELDEIKTLVDRDQAEAAFPRLEAFRAAHKESPYFQMSRLLEANAYFSQGLFAKALEIENSIIDLGPEKNPVLWAHARYEATFAYEAMGDTVKALTMLVGLEKSNAKLTAQVLSAELPARMALIYAKLGRDKEAGQYLDKADRGLKFLLGQDSNPDKSWVAETLYRMGLVSNASLTAENFSALVEGERRLQNYLLQAMEQGDDLWSKKASNHLIQNYRQYWEFILRQEDRPDRHQDFLKQLHELLSESMYRKPAEASLWNAALTDYFAFAAQLDRDLTAALLGSGGTLMTPEARKRGGTKRAGHVKATQALPAEKPKPNPKDPNL